VRKLLVIVLTLIVGLMVLIAGCGPGVSPTVVPSSSPEVSPGPAVRLVFTTQPVGAIAGSAFNTQPVVAVEDAEGNIVTSYLGLIVLTVTAGTGASKARLFGGTKVGLVNGMVEFRDLCINKAGVDYTLTASNGNLIPATSAPFTILPGAPAKLGFTTQPSSGEAGSLLTPNPEVTVQDFYGNMVTSYEGSVTVKAIVAYEEYTDPNQPQPSVQTFPVPLSGTTTVRVVNGVARFTDISSNFAMPGYSFIAVSDSLESATSTSFTISPAAPASLLISVQPEGAKAGTPFETQPKVAIVDTYGNVVTSSRASITLSIAPDSGTAGAVLSGTTTLVAEGGLGGLAVFKDLSIDQVGSAYILTATSSGLTSATSQAFDVSAP